MPRQPWRVRMKILYFRGMGKRRAPREIEPVRLLPGLDQYEGLWVAVKDGEVVAAARNSRDLVPEVKKLGPAGEGAVAQFVPPYSEEIVIGVG
jgi:uncharacterized protein DUF5678